ncbi:hypothetical protein Ae406Ps2_5799 [Pseudonocardia sp. Ae406_Ps2]|nr:hypothetical protein Ae331Ps2_0161c [Pseudonocardia sp. Ae331_Ps2]OLM05799.1 hypothetical protein Ae406Ps2_5799 [Pseudonocardia sp. Ae406_Ps2]OLM15043.1 hypothetical protein Ae505Ps2_5175c [Pseudonocardia sp. Ae505_Ps2]OLM27374.1 hypothetical protein Ae706Ps2_5808 [Pseudonocardia sp. Ae706_Ps2]
MTGCAGAVTGRDHRLSGAGRRGRRANGGWSSRRSWKRRVTSP